MALNSNQVKSLQAGVHADTGGLYLVVRRSGDRVWAFRFTDPEGKRAQMEFARAGDRDSAGGDVLTLSSAREGTRLQGCARASIRATKSGAMADFG
ncbi:MULTISPECIES: integrase arm-type DNA-binding domain-containing protein [Bradyrhizobium]|uniref:integrase arm-type DNA-binding domain-containing protein n=2 Tax=Nitrobacteraceae TaxID=41294 RepID=UPI0005586759